MARKNRTELDTTIAAWAATLNLTTTHRPDVREIIENCVLLKDVSDTSSATSTPHDIDWDGVDYHEVTLNNVTVVITFSNISQGEIKYLKVIEGTDNDHSFSGATLVATKAANEFTLPVIYQVINKDSTVYVVPVNRESTYDAASDVQAKGLSSDSVFLTPGNLGAVTDGLLTEVIDIGDWDMDTTSSIPVAHGLTQSKIRTVTATIRSDDGSIVVFFP